jgi:hypothetical protein
VAAGLAEVTRTVHDVWLGLALIVAAIAFALLPVALTRGPSTGRARSLRGSWQTTCS